MKTVLLTICLVALAFVLAGCNSEVVSWETHPEVMENSLRTTKHTSEIMGSENDVVSNVGVTYGKH